MHRTHRAALAALLALALVIGCTSDAERLIEVRSELRGELDPLYARYGGGALAQAGADAGREEGAGAATATRFLAEVDRSYFEGQCLARGRGERPFNLSGKLDAFLQEPANEEACRRAAKLELRVRELEAKAAAR